MNHIITKSAIIRYLHCIWHVPRHTLMALIRLYQLTLSPDHGWMKSFYPFGYCKFSPTCSQYGYEALKTYGCIRGVIQTMWRILRCNPFSHGGFDPVDKNNKKCNHTN